MADDGGADPEALSGSTTLMWVGVAISTFFAVGYVSSTMVALGFWVNTGLGALAAVGVVIGLRMFLAGRQPRPK